jgi:hypothetical protein
MIMKWILLLMLVLVGGIHAAGTHEILSYASMETEYEDMQLLVEAMWYKVPAMDVIEVSVSLLEPTNSSLYPVFYLRYPDGEITDSALRPLEDEEDCLGDVDTISVKFWIWCHDFGGWSIFMFTEENVFERIGRTKLDYPIGDWAVIVVDRETEDVIAELPLYVEIFKPTGKPPISIVTKID